MKEINWNIFRVKFNGKEQSSFEYLSYQLFCTEHNNNIGIFRFKHQAGIETEPIQSDEGLIGFQAKFYDTKISDNKNDIIDSIKKAKRENPNLNKILLYINQEFSESSIKEKKSPDYKTEIESEANKVNLNIEWRVPSHFERQLALPENQYLTDFYFDQGKNILDFVEGLKKHTENLFISIQTDVVFNSQEIKIDRQQIIQTIDVGLRDTKTIILSGEGGCGKTAIIKDSFQKYKDLIPFYVFKAVEFNIQEIKSLFKNYGDYSLNDFIAAHKEEKQKIIVIDSAERISDIEYQEPFKEFLAELLKNSWSIIFTTRLSYLDDLRFQFLSVYRLPFEHISINNLSDEELEALAEQYSFELPTNVRMKSIIRNPLYLDEYLKNYTDDSNSVLYYQFKEKIWLRKIQNSSFTKDNTHILREKCFLNITKIRTERNSFYITPTECLDNILSLLQKDDIIGYDKNSGGYFITHDIYEEWGINLLIERAYNSQQDYNDFLNEIGTSLIVRRAFRQWLSDKLMDNIEDIKPFIEETFESDNIETFWKDETLTSVLLSDYSSEFFVQFKEKIQGNDYAILKKIIFLLRITCKETDDSLSKLLDTSQGINLNYVFTKPKGKGWNSIIHLIYENKDSTPLSFIPYIIPLLTDWCSNNKRGNTTHEAGLLALKFYTDIKTNDRYKYTSEFSNPLINIIIQSVNEIKTELTALFDEVLTCSHFDRREVYYDLCKAVISSDMENITIIIALPEYVLKLADLYWIDSSKEKDSYSNLGVEKYYGLNEYGHNSYFPASALQTPIYWLLRFSYSKTIDFIIDFTNKTVKNYVDSGFDRNVLEIELIHEEGKTHKQYLSHSLWNMYRGSGSPVSPYLLQSMHMALEKYFLEIAKNEDPKVVENRLLYLIEKSNSTSITSVVTSIVLAYPNKFFNVSKVLFSCSEFFLYDNFRAKIGENEAKNIYSIGRGLDYKTKHFENERLKTCEDNHRRHSLESLILNYQFFRDEQVSEGEAKKKQKEIWGIIDKFYSELPEKVKETDEDKTKRLLLARIDRRKMNPKLERKEDKLIIDFNPEIDDELKNHSEEIVRKSDEMMKYSALKLWAIFKFDNSKKYGDYPQYENNPLLVLEETKAIIELRTNQDENFQLFNSSIPAYTCSTLIREYSSVLSDKEKRFCAEIIIEYATLPFHSNYQYQISDGVEVAINALPFLIELFPDEKEELLTILLLILFDPTPIGQYKRVCDYVIESVLNNLWRISFEDAQKVLWGFLKFKPIFDSVLSEIKKTSIKSHEWTRYTQNEIISRFIEKHGNEVTTFLSNVLKIENIDLNEYSLQDLDIAFQLVPYDTNNTDLISFVYRISPVFAEKLLENDRNTDREREIDYSLRQRVFTKFSYFILFRNPKDIKKHIQPFVNNFSANEHMASLFHELISIQNNVNKYEQFWIVWESFYEKLKEISLSGGYHLSEVVHDYLLAWNYWKETAKSWHSLKEREKTFYKKVVKELGHLPCVLDSIAKLLNGIASEFLNEGIIWISDMVEKNIGNKLETNTVYYIEKLVRKYIYLNRNKVRQDIKTKKRILIILNFLIERGSVNAYLLREDIL